MVPPIGTLLDGVNTRTGLMEAPATPPEVMEMNTIPVMAPLDARLEAVGSALVCTVTESVAALAAPIAQPTSVTVTAVPAASALPEAVKTTEVLPGAAGTRVAPAADDLAVGVGEAAKKPDG